MIEDSTVGIEELAPTVSVIVVSFNTRDLLRECLTALYKELTGILSEVLVIDNASRDNSAVMVAAEFPQARLFTSDVNLGFGPANNVALNEARGSYIVLLNSDAFFGEGALRIAIAQMEKHPKAGLGGAMLVGRDGEWQPSARMFPSILNDLLMFTGLSAKYPKSRFFGRGDRTWDDPQREAQVDWVPGAFSIIRREVLQRVGFFDPRFFLYYEEVDLCLRIHQAGYELWYWPQIRVVHIGGESSRTHGEIEMSSSGSQLVLWRMRSALLYFRKHHGWQAWLLQWMERSLYLLSGLRNRFSSDSRRVARRREMLRLNQTMQRAWHETDGGRVSPPAPW